VHADEESLFDFDIREVRMIVPDAGAHHFSTVVEHTERSKESLFVR
jgi:hypothetical protein